MDESSRELVSIFGQALERSTPAERQAFLQGACPDPAIRAHVEALLQAHLEAGDFLKGRSASDSTTATLHAPSLERPGTVIGPYKLLQQIGEGGMGTVFMAEQSQPVHRRVALKIIKPGMDSRQVIARFEAERQALALMDHPNIAKVLDAGETSGGRPYFVMELVNGVPITKFCDGQHAQPKQRLELFVQVCHAVQHAHQKGIIHRDLKPSNVLIALYDGRPVPKIIDFGVAKATGPKLTDRTMFTEFGQVVGTLEYMSPEQAERNQLDIDTRSDIYSLGVLLYELLTGTTPLDRKRLKEAALLEVLRIIREEEPPKPSTRLSTTDELPAIAANRGMEPKKLSGLVRGELDWIVMKCLDKERNRRYETANGLAMDLQRYLADEPVQACPPSLPYRFRKFARRNRMPLLAGAVVVIALLAGTAVSIWQAVRATRALTAEEAERQRANDNLARAIDAVEQFLVRMTADVRLQQADLHELRLGLVGSAIPFYEEFVKQRRDDPELEWNRGKAFRSLTLIRWVMGDHTKAMHEQQQARAIFDELVMSHPHERHYRQSLGSAIQDLGNLLREIGKPKEAEKEFRDSLAIKKQLVADFPEIVQYHVDLGMQYGNLGLVLLEQGRVADAIVSLREVPKILDPLMTGPGVSPDVRKILAGSHVNLGFLLYRQNDASCEVELRAAIRLFQPLFAEFPNVPDYQRLMAQTYNHLGNFQRDSQLPDEALKSFEEALKLYEPLAEKFAMVPNYRSELGGTLNNIAMVRINQGRLHEAQTLVERAIVQQRAALKLNSRNPFYREFLSNHLGILADVLVRQGEHAAAAAAAIELADVRVTNGEDAYDAAAFLAQAVVLAQKDANLPPPKRAELVQRYADQAMNLLREAVKRGFKEVDRFAKDKELDPLRMRLDFQKLLAELQGTKSDK